MALPIFCMLPSSPRFYSRPSGQETLLHALCPLIHISVEPKKIIFMSSEVRIEKFLSIMTKNV